MMVELVSEKLLESADDAVQGRKGTPLPDSSTVRVQCDDEADKTVAPTKSSPLARRLQRGDGIGRYLVLDHIGSGGMGQVYRAFDPELAREVAIKLLDVGGGQAASTNRSSSIRARAFREAQALARLSHPNVLPIYDVGTFGDQVFLATELVSGGDLRRWLKEKRRSWRELLGVFIAAGRGLCAAHEAGIVHRDFKPDNVLMSVDGAVRVMDFGLARRIDDATAEDLHLVSPEPEGDRESDESTPARRGEPEELASEVFSSSLTVAGTVMGTPAYMSPEQHRGAEVDARSDQYAFCAALYEALYGQPPFHTEARAALPAAKERQKLALVPRDRERAVPRWIREILLRGMAPKPEDRFPSMGELLEALQNDPMKRVRKVVAVAGVLAVIGLAVFTGAKLQGPAVDCSLGQESLSGVWDSGVKQRVRSAFLATDLPYAESTLERLEGRLDDYADAWAGMHQESCEATHVRHEQSEHLLDLRTRCLQRSLRDLEQVTTAFASADQNLVEHALKVVTELDDVERCGDTEALTLDVAPPKDPGIARRVEQLRDSLTRAGLLMKSGSPTEAIELARAVLEDAEATGYEPVQAETLVKLGSFQARTGQFEGAAEVLTRGVWLAHGNKLDALAAEAEARLVHVVGYGLRSDASAEQWAHQAEATLKRIGGSKRIRAMLESSRGNVFYVQDKRQEAFDAMSTAAELQLEVEGSDSPTLVHTWSNLGVMAHSLGREDAEVHLERAHALAVRVLGPEHPFVGFPLVNLGWVTRSQGRYEEAVKHYQDALELFRNSGGSERHVLSIWTNLADVHIQQEHWEAAVEAAQKGMAVAEQAYGGQSPDYAGAMVMLADARLGQENLEEALASYREAVDVLDSHAVADQRLAAPLLGLGTALLADGSTQQAIQALERARKLVSPSPTQARVLFVLAQAQAQRNRTATAIDLARQAQQQLKSSSDQPDVVKRTEIEDWLEAHGASEGD